MLAAFNAADSFILAVVLMDGAFVHHPLYLPNPTPVFGPEPGFNEVSRAIFCGGDQARGERGMTEPLGGGSAAGGAPIAAAHRRRNDEGRAMATIGGDT